MTLRRRIEELEDRLPSRDAAWEAAKRYLRTGELPSSPRVAEKVQAFGDAIRELSPIPAEEAWRLLEPNGDALLAFLEKLKDTGQRAASAPSPSLRLIREGPSWIRFMLAVEGVWGPEDPAVDSRVLEPLRKLGTWLDALSEAGRINVALPAHEQVLHAIKISTAEEKEAVLGLVRELEEACLRYLEAHPGNRDVSETFSRGDGHWTTWQDAYGPEFRSGLDCLFATLRARERR